MFHAGMERPRLGRDREEPYEQTYPNYMLPDSVGKQAQKHPPQRTADRLLDLVGPVNLDSSADGGGIRSVFNIYVQTVCHLACALRMPIGDFKRVQMQR